MNTDRNIVIVGCGAGGGTAAQFARKTDRKAKITVFEKSNYPQYSKCGLPYVLSGRVPNLDDVIEFSQDWFKKNNIDLILNATVEKIDADKQIIYVKKDGSSIQEAYDSLIIATGGKPFVPPIENIGADGVFPVRTIEDMKAISPFIKKGKNAVIVGAGFIGIEMADSLHKKGMNVSIIEALPNILPTILDADMSKLVLDKIPEDISIFTNHVALKVQDKNGKINRVLIKDNSSNEGKKIDADILINSTGVVPEVELAKNAGCKLGETGGIIVNNKCETNVKNIYAVGDCTEYIDFVTKQPILVGLGSIAVRQGITAGINSSGGNYEMPGGLLQTSASEFFGMEIASVGPTTNSIKDISIVSGKYSGSSLLYYFPGGKPITMKVTVDEDNGKILNAQAIGDKAAQRINTFACAILSGMDVETFRKLETAYAPPISPTLDAETLVCDIVSLKLNRKR